MNCLISARTAVLDALAPDSVPSPEPKKYFSSNVPMGVAMYLAVVTRLMVDSCKPSSSAISRNTIGFMAKLLAEDIEDLDWKQVEAVRATGASWWQTMNHAVQPQVMPRFIGFCACQLDSNLRNSTMVGIVGGGGIGAALFTAYQRFDYDVVTTIVLDHMSVPDVKKGVEHPEFGRYLKLLDKNKNIWSKVSCPERLTVAGAPYDDVVPFAKTLVERYPDRVLWGTDWPHPNLKDHMPDDGLLVDLIPHIAPSAELQRKLLVDNPMRLYWPEEVA